MNYRNAPINIFVTIIQDNIVLSSNSIISDIYRIYHTNIYGNTNFLPFPPSPTRDANSPCISDNFSNSNDKKTTLFGRPDTHFNIHLIS